MTDRKTGQNNHFVRFFLTIYNYKHSFFKERYYDNPYACRISGSIIY